ncbi:hypothetical protein KIL84_006237, partial [Mauremys mutica]
AGQAAEPGDSLRSVKVTAGQRGVPEEYAAPPASCTAPGGSPGPRTLPRGSDPAQPQARPPGPRPQPPRGPRLPPPPRGAPLPPCPMDCSRPVGGGAMPRGGPGPCHRLRRAALE